MTLFAPMEAAVREALQIDGVVQAGLHLRREGIVESMYNTTNPQLREALFHLLTAALDRYTEVLKDPKRLQAEVDLLARKLEERPFMELKPFARRLREKYPQKQ